MPSRNFRRDCTEFLVNIEVLERMLKFFNDHCEAELPNAEGVESATGVRRS